MDSESHGSTRQVERRQRGPGQVVTGSPARVAVFTRAGSTYGLRLLNALGRGGLAPDAVVVADESIGRRVRLLRSVARRLGWLEALGAAAEALPAMWSSDPDSWRGKPLVRDYARLAPHVLHVASFNTLNAVTAIAELRADVILLGHTGILRAPVLATARLGVLNAHPGWLPEFRGVHPAWWTLAEGRTDLLGSTLHVVDAGIDTGPIVGRRVLDQTGLPPYERLEERLYEDCIDLLVEAAGVVRAGGPLAGAPQLPGAGTLYSVAPRRVRRQARAAYEALRRTTPR